jgi:uncharacterized repeat protein (TIGR03837 family)
MGAKLLWDVFCRVIDNHGDLGVCWRLAADLAARGHRVRLWVDDAAALAWMAPHGADGVAVLPWRDPLPGETPGNVVVEAFGCDPPAAFVRAMQGRPGCVWINLEYLSAEAYVERSHGLASPQFSGAGAGLTKWFFYPGFSAATGGLLREPDLPARQAGFDRASFLAGLGVAADATRPRVSLFAYPHAPVAELLAWLAPSGAQVLVCPGAVQAAVQAQAAAHPSLTVHSLPWLSQPDYDRLLWTCDLNFVRGEDSFVRAQWAGAPFVWQIYAQDDGVHKEKLDAFLDRHLQEADAPLAAAVARLSRAWNGLAPWPERLPPLAPWHAHTLRWRSGLGEQSDLTTALEAFVAAKR